MDRHKTALFKKPLDGGHYPYLASDWGKATSLGKAWGDYQDIPNNP